MSTNYTVQDLRIQPEQKEKTASDMLIVVRNQRLGGHFSVMEGEVQPNAILGFHSHVNEDQHMYIIAGELHFEVGGADGLRFTAKAGDHVLKPRGSSHGFWNLGDETARYIETSTEDGFEHFIDGRQDGLSSMLGSATANLGMSFETARTLEVMKEFGLDGLAGANISNPAELIADPAFHEMMRTNEVARELFAYLGGAKIKAFIQARL